MGSSSWFSSSSSTLCCVELLLLAARREKHHQDPKDAKMAALSFGFFVCVSSWLRPDPDWCHVTRVYFPTFFSSLPSLSLTFRSFQRSVRLSPFFFFSLASLGRLSHRRTLRDWAVSVCIHFPRRFKYLCYTAAAPSCVPLICSFSLLLFLLFIHVQFFKNQKLVEGEISF